MVDWKVVKSADSMDAVMADSKAAQKVADWVVARVVSMAALKAE